MESADTLPATSSGWVAQAEARGFDFEADPETNRRLRE